MLRAAWSGHWRSPWGLGKGRRFGDFSWALASVAIAWLQGGRDGTWPRQTWIGTPGGPRPEGPPEGWRPLPDPAWIALLRHGSTGVPAERPGSKEGLLEGMAWEALLRGEARPFLHLGLTHLDLDTRLRWIPALGAVDAEGTLHLPPFLDPLVPKAFQALPPGWWDRLLGSMDPDGLLLPQGAPPPWIGALQPEGLQAFSTSTPPSEIPEASRMKLSDGRWVIDPALRAWFRGEGARPLALRGLQPMTLGLGGDPDPQIRAFLDGQIPEGMDAAWQACLEADLKELPTPAPPPPSGNPTWDWIRVRWGAVPPDPSPGYPDATHFPGASCDPFHAMGMGRLWYRRGDVEKAMWASAFAHSQMRHIKSLIWAERAAYNASWEALFWGDVNKSNAFLSHVGPLPHPFEVLKKLHDLLLLGEFREVLTRLPSVEAHPKAVHQARVLRAHALINLGEWEAVTALDPAELPGDLGRVVRAIRSGQFEPRPTDLDEEHALLWESLRARRDTYHSEIFWPVWEACPNALMRLGTGLLVMERRPEARIPARVILLQELARRCGSETLRARLSALWPAGPSATERSPSDQLEHLLSRHPGSAWIRWGEAFEHLLGHGDAPPEVLLDLLPQRDSLEPLASEGVVWWGRALRWNGAPVGWLLLGFPQEQPFEIPAWADLLAPWVAALAASAPKHLVVEGQLLLTNGSEPMATFMRDLDEVAPSRLPVLLLGPSGSGKELAAREVHLRSGRKGPLVAVNCSEFAPGVLESELFGHLKGAFTGATRDKIGAIESARGGTLFLDEIADLDPRLQSMLLRVLQEREIRRVGSDRAVQVDVRFIAATHRDLDVLVREGRFRKDLLFRLQGAQLRLPSLDERRHELPWLLPRLLVQICREEQLEIPAVAPGLAQALGRRRWPGNFRELRHLLQRALLRAQGDTLEAVHFPELSDEQGALRSWEEATRTFQRRLLLDALKAHEFQVAETARTLGLARPALYAAAKRLGVDLVAERHREGAKG